MQTPTTVRLTEHDRPALEAHFMALGGEDRRLRFGASIGDEGLRSYVARIDFERDGIFAVQDENLCLLAVVHIAVTQSAELGLSVLHGLRGQGLGSSLFARAVMHLRNRGLREVFVHCIAENAAMMHLARKHGMRLVSAGSESDGRLALAPATAQSYIAEWLDDQQGRTIRALRENSLSAQRMFGLLPR
ncbi:MAG: GNAT family N-acetyltransferase [Pseudomonadota bacterium]|nr:GNAT family N-acetyltransferase [Pseudomonadota bacterium]